MRVALILLALVVSAFGLAALEPVGVVLGPVPVLEVVDGDTVVLESDLGPRVVRLIGIDAPESGEAMAHGAADLLRDLMPHRATVHVELDLELEDAYGRLLAYLYVQDAAGAWTVQGEPATMVNLAVARAGLARAMTIPPNAVYADLFELAVDEARSAGRGLWRERRTVDPGGEPGGIDGGWPSGAIVIRCAMYDPIAELDAGAEWVAVELRERLDTRGYYLWDEGSRTSLALPPGEHGPGELRVANPGQGIWNNGGDTIYLMRAGEVVDAWDYSRTRSAQGAAVCRGDD